MTRYFLLFAVFITANVNANTEQNDRGFTLGGFTEAVVIVADIEKSSALYQEIAGWEERVNDTPDSALRALWKLPKQATLKQRLLANKGENKGYLRLVEISGVPQQQIRSNTQSWDTGGIFDINVRAKDMDSKFAQLQQLGWSSDSDPIQFSFGPFVVKEWIVTSPDAVAFAIIERIKPELEGWDNLQQLSRVFNATQVVKDIDTSLDFYRNVLGFKTYLEHRGASKEAGPNVLGLPYNLTTEIERSVYILHPQGVNEGSVELLQFHGATGKDMGERAAPPNLGVVTLRFPVDNIDALAEHLKSRNIHIQSRTKLELLPYGLVDILAIKTPDQTWLEFYSTR